MFYNNKLNSYDIGSMQQSAWDDGFEDGMKEIKELIKTYKAENSGSLVHGMIITGLEEYIEKKMPRRE